MKIEIETRNSTTRIYLRDLSIKDLQFIISTLTLEMELRVKEKQASDWTEDDTPEYESGFGICAHSAEVALQEMKQ